MRCPTGRIRRRADIQGVRSLMEIHKMKSSQHRRHIMALAVCALVAAGPLSAKTAPKPAAAASAEQAVAAAPGGQANYGVKLGGFFNDQHRKAVRTAFAQRYGKGKDCPAGMERGAKGCAPPVEGRYWAVGQMLQPAVKPNPVPDPIAAKLPPAPNGQTDAKAIHAPMEVCPEA